MATIGLKDLVADFAAAMRSVDAQCPPAVSLRTGRVYGAGIGPYAESRAIELVIAEMQRQRASVYDSLRTGIAYPGERKSCDLVLGDTPEWAIEIKMARFWGDNGKPDDTAIKDILSPYSDDRSALTDCLKLAGSGFDCRKAVLIYGFENTRRPLEPVIEAFERLAASRVKLGPRQSAELGALVHPEHSAGQVIAWEISFPDPA